MIRLRYQNIPPLRLFTRELLIESARSRSVYSIEMIL